METIKYRCEYHHRPTAHAQVSSATQYDGGACCCGGRFIQQSRTLTHVEAINLRNQLRQNLANFKTACRVGAINMSLTEKIEMERNLKAAVDRTYVETEKEDPEYTDDRLPRGMLTESI